MIKRSYFAHVGFFLKLIFYDHNIQYYGVNLFALQYKHTLHIVKLFPQADVLFHH